MKQELTDLLTRRDTAVSLIAALESQLTAAKENLRQIEEEEAPVLFETEGIEEATLADGRVLSVPPFYRASIPAEGKDAFYQWMDDNGFGELAPTSVVVNFDKQDAAAREQLMKAAERMGKVPVLERSLHPSTLKAWVKRQFEEGNPLPPSLKTYTGKKLKIK